MPWRLPRWLPLWLALAGTAAASEQDCRLALVLAVDVSSSVDASEHSLQRRGLAAALTDPDVAHAMLDGGGPVALTIFEWSGRHQQNILQDWTLLTNRADLAAVADRMLTLPRSFTGEPTAIGDALNFTARLLQRAPICARQVVDVSGDGITNQGPRPQMVYRQPAFAGVTVNGLTVTGDDPRVVPYYQQEVLHGPLAFLERASGYEEFQAAMIRKLYRETRALVIGSLPQRHP
ncbi:DUF1194 domain-containing protein [Marinovum sp. 2_MG-2023]|uniref:DUF1194 domain-containing protein n=1 Tax=Roseobacteraceae TaxID=2854170 RepID=UPI001FD0008C|nr:MULTISPECIES: DUF1194 domain-containing protein [Roseobacteraceae]MCJ7871850.1 DUF1194 domain-containing protein [Phaeobacter sp. J2-8]MDO6728706.1 DUF1194 domain-containing protein [Marinovum sp. 2_MG-2023]MDO6777878.1 DUF1194 domain-containing protein [Marinovum sp. 1_MG-2023]